MITIVNSDTDAHVEIYSTHDVVSTPRGYKIELPELTSNREDILKEIQTTINTITYDLVRDIINKY